MGNGQSNPNANTQSQQSSTKSNGLPGLENQGAIATQEILAAINDVNTRTATQYQTVLNQIQTLQNKCSPVIASPIVASPAVAHFNPSIGLYEHFGLDGYNWLFILIVIIFISFLVINYQH